jgi:hypothetical protein
MLINQWLFPRSKTIHNPHLLLSLGRKPSDPLTLDNRVAGDRVEKASKDSWAMAAVLLLGITATRSD